ncbi:hypothetical protein [Pedobacter hiemivivus]|uniref:TerB family tellurite resistance protein n=1 Tax=Pedobacter hiemivivus TaxID=2530454 RepID=A0A4R0NDL6_9SPHI|nr:hypothetical protein [Pedobacter hiemivivus]TCC98480.1 hypothetical protein EZ444_04140 [Pedobacter hiemivivus]
MNWIRKIACLVVVFCIGFAQLSQAQTWSEWFKQKKTQKKYLLQQIVALEVYAGYLKKGYKIVDGGLSTIRDITHGEFNLHNAFISSLKQVSPAIRKDARIAEIIALQVSIMKAFGGIKGNALLSAKNLDYIAVVADQLIASCYDDLEELLLVITAGRLEMKDDERLSRLDKVYESMLEKSAFSQDFIGNTRQLIRHRQSEVLELEDMNRMFHFKE